MNITVSYKQITLVGKKSDPLRENQPLARNIETEIAVLKVKRFFFLKSKSIH